MTTKRVEALRFQSGTPETRCDALVVEAPLQIKINGVAYTTTMRTPGEDAELVRGLLFTEGIVTDAQSPFGLREIKDPETRHISCLEVSMDPAHLAKDIEGLRSQISTASCGVCGTRDLASLEVAGPALDGTSAASFDVALLASMLARMAAAQVQFAETGGAHAAALFTLQGDLLICREDVGRHNAVDKAIGAALAGEFIAQAACLLVSGRVSYEIVYKAYRACVPILAAISAPSSFAVETAERLGVTLIAFCRGECATVYSHGLRLRHVDSAVARR